MFIKRKFDKVIVGLVLVGVFLYASIRQSFHIRPDMPKGFVNLTGPTQDQAQEQRIAMAYWTCVVKQIQWKYGYGYHLPETAPSEFAIATDVPNPGTQAARDRYWHNVRDIWYDPGTWVTEYRWDFAWAKNPVRSASDWLQEHFGKLSL